MLGQDLINVLQTLQHIRIEIVRCSPWSGRPDVLIQPISFQSVTQRMIADIDQILPPQSERASLSIDHTGRIQSLYTVETNYWPKLRALLAPSIRQYFHCLGNIRFAQYWSIAGACVKELPRLNLTPAVLPIDFFCACSHCIEKEPCPHMLTSACRFRLLSQGRMAIPGVGCAMPPYFAESFRETIASAFRSLLVDLEGHSKPTLVLDEHVERTTNTAPRTSFDEAIPDARPASHGEDTPSPTSEQRIIN